MSSLSGLPTYPQLSDINYAEWCINTKALLQSQKLWRLVSGTLKKPDETKFKSPPTEAQLSSLEDWEDRSERACGILSMSISPGQKPNITDCQDDPVAIWTKLKSVHEAQKPSNRFNAYEDLLSIRKDSDESLSSLINRTEPEPFNHFQYSTGSCCLPTLLWSVHSHCHLPKNSRLNSGMLIQGPLLI
ncbi:hypothetical protein HWV62_8825 [Athelia sp. TMB]|nr:hypothetical protein HWV62_8825 [Athelia sp. TMB]